MIRAALRAIKRLVGHYLPQPPRAYPITAIWLRTVGAEGSQTVEVLIEEPDGTWRRVIESCGDGCNISHIANGWAFGRKPVVDLGPGPGEIHDAEIGDELGVEH